MGDSQEMRSVNRKPRVNITPAIVLLALAALALLIIFSTSFIVVDQTERAVITTFGKFTKVADPGLAFKWPFGIQKAYHVKTEVVQTEQFGFRTEKAGVVTQYSPKEYPRGIDHAHRGPQHRQRRVDHPVQDHRPQGLALQRAATSRRRYATYPSRSSTSSSATGPSSASSGPSARRSRNRQSR